MKGWKGFFMQVSDPDSVQQHDFQVRCMHRAATTGQLHFGGRSFDCALGRSGITTQKREGDGASPAGAYTLLCGFYRADRLAKPVTQLPMRPMLELDGWCDDPHDARYNQLITLPFAGSHETLWRDDQLYDVVVVLDQNIHPRRPGGGSAIFFHIAAPGFTPTEGCIAVSHATMNHALKFARRGSKMQIG